MNKKYPVNFSVDYPKRELNRVTTFFRFIVAIPILIVLGAVSASSASSDTSGSHMVVGAGGLLFFGPLLMIVFRQKYPRWWFDWNLELMRFSARVGVYLALMDDRYPSTDEHQAVHLDVKYPDVKKELNQLLPLVKWFLALPHYFVLVFLDFAAVLMILVAWFNIMITGKFPRSIFDFLVNVGRWNIRVTNYALVLTTDQYPPFNFTE